METIKTIDGERAYQIYNVEVKWTYDGVSNPEYPKWHEDLPEGRLWNGTSFKHMSKEDITLDEMTTIAQEWWDRYKETDKTKRTNPILTDLKVSFLEYETWNLNWFSHETFDVGQNDIEALESFERFVKRKEILMAENASKESYSEKYAVCLMGAEDRWRWFGTQDDNGDNTPAPCRCENCKKAGMLRISH